MNIKKKGIFFWIILGAFTFCMIVFPDNTGISTPDDMRNRINEFAAKLEITLGDRKGIPQGKIHLFPKDITSINVGAYKIQLDLKEPYPWGTKDIIGIDIIDSSNRIVAKGVISLFETCNEALTAILSDMVCNSMPMQMVIADKEIVNDIGNVCIKKKEYNHKNKVYDPVYCFVRNSTTVKLISVSTTTNLLDVAKTVDKMIIGADVEILEKEDKP